MELEKDLERYEKVLNTINNEDNQMYMVTLSMNVSNLNEYVKFIIQQQEYLLAKMEIENNKVEIEYMNNYGIGEIMKIISLSSLVYLSKCSNKGIGEIENENKELFKKKNKDYGKSYEDFGLIGIIIRMNDKINRIKSICIKNEIEVKNEKIEDSINDLYNYTILGLMLHKK